MRLNDKDARAVEWIMSQQQTADGGSFASSDAGDPAFTQRANQVQNLLALLDLLPAEQPPANLVRRTLDRIRGEVSTGGVAESDADQPSA